MFLFMNQFTWLKTVCLNILCSLLCSKLYNFFKKTDIYNTTFNFQVTDVVPSLLRLYVCVFMYVYNICIYIWHFFCIWYLSAAKCFERKKKQEEDGAIMDGSKGQNTPTFSMLYSEIRKRKVDIMSAFPRLTFHHFILK